MFKILLKYKNIIRKLYFKYQQLKYLWRKMALAPEIIIIIIITINIWQDC